jgi:hypothetical protein
MTDEPMPSVFRDLARLAGIEGSREELEAWGRKLAAGLERATDSDLATLIDGEPAQPAPDLDLDVEDLTEAELAELDGDRELAALFDGRPARPALTPAAPTPTPASVPTPSSGWVNGRWVETRAQARDAGWCALHNADRGKAAAAGTYDLID